MIKLSAAFRLAACTLALACLDGVAATSRASSETTANTARSGTLTLGGTNTYTGTTTLNAGTYNAGSLSLPSGTTVGFNTSTDPGLHGSVEGLQLKNTAKGDTRVKADLVLSNTSSTVLHNVTATVYLSDDNTLSADDTTITTLNLSDYVPKGKVGKHKIFALPFNYKVPSLVASYLSGKYLIVTLAADDLGSLATEPIVIGPITLP